MSTVPCNSPINSLSWWENNFENDWEKNRGREQTRHFMQILAANLPEAEREYLASHNVTVLDWGCALGEGVDVLAKAFSQCRVAGLDFAPRAIAEARHSHPGLEFLHTENGQIPGEFDVIVTSNCLEHFDNPLKIIEGHLPSCRQLYIILVPYMEAPMCESHKSQFRDECFPQRILGFTRICSKPVEVDRSIWDAKQILVIYASPSYLDTRNRSAARLKEKAKWNAHYASLPPPEYSYYSPGFSDELADRIAELLPDGGKVMEIGCGGGEQSLALARRDCPNFGGGRQECLPSYAKTETVPFAERKQKFNLTLADFSEQALEYARKMFAVHKLPAEFQLCDAFSLGSAECDLAFNVRVLEDYTIEEQAQFLRSMARHSRKYVLALVPNNQCYWYWIWRSQKTGNGLWPFGKEVPLANLSQTFEQAGLRFIGQAYLGANITENFINEIEGLDEDARDTVLQIHRSGMIPVSQSAYLVAALGTVSAEAGEIPTCWTEAKINNDQKICELTAALSDALSGRISAEAQKRRLENIITERTGELNALRERLAYAEKQLTTPRKIIRSLPLGIARRFASRSLRWTISHCPRRVLYFADRQRPLLSCLLPQRVKEYLKTACAAKPNIPLRNQLDQFISHVTANNPSKRIFLIFSGTTFTESEGQRPTRLARELARRGIPVIFAYWRWNALEPVQISVYPGVFCLPIDELRKDFQTLLTDARLSQFDRTFMMEFPHPSLMEIVNYANVQGWRTVYDAIDDWEQFRKQGQAAWYDRDMEIYLLQNSGVTTVTCENLLKKMIAMGADRAHLLPNAYEDWTTAGRTEIPPVHKGRITIGYFGHLTGSWFDWRLITAVAKRHPDWVFQIIGYGLDKSVTPLNNVLLLGKAEHRDLPAYARNWDVAMIPFQQSNLSMAVDPIKIYEYISLGLHTVVTGMPHLASYPGVLTAGNDMEFEASVEKAASQRINPATVEAFLGANRWSNRIDALLKLLDAQGHSSAVSLAFTKEMTPPNIAAA